MYCTSCGRRLNENQNFCDECGAKVYKRSDNETNNKNEDDITFYNNRSNFYNNNYHRQQNYVYDPSEGKALGIVCALFVPLLISIFLGLIYKDSKSRSNYYKYFGITFLIKLCVFVVAFIIFFAIIISTLPPSEMIFIIFKK